ncbi:MAG: AMP-binding protein, partial [Xanthomonadales bacterium]|nr:AMP-binding protein [Xanthomonadales bacterium]
MAVAYGEHTRSALTQPDFENVATAAIDAGQNLAQLLLSTSGRLGQKIAFTNMDVGLSHADLLRHSAHLAAYLRHGLQLQAGERVAIMMPNLLQFPIALLGVLRADLIAVLVNPMYTARELRHQLSDSGAKALIVVDNFGQVAAEALDGTSVRHVITTGIGDQLGFPKSLLTNFVLRRVKKLVPPFHIAGAIRWSKALAAGAGHPVPEPQASASDTVQLQYTGGTTGVSKGAALSHAAVMANVAACEQWLGLSLDPARDIALICLPLYHIAA